MEPKTKKPNTNTDVPAADAGGDPAAQSRHAPVKVDTNQVRRSPRTPDPIEQILKDLAQGIGQLSSWLQSIEQCQTSMVDRLAECKLEGQILADLQKEYQGLRERFHEREVLLPIVRGLIGIADRCHNENAEMRKTLEDLQGRLSLKVLTIVDHLLRARDADRVEIEDLLARYGVETYRYSGDQFDARHQKCVAKRPTPQASRYQKIAARLLPGYRHNGTIIRPEYVAVYVAGNSR